MKVWIVYGYTPCEEEDTFSAHDTEEKAIAAAQKMRERCMDFDYYDYYELEVK